MQAIYLANHFCIDDKIFQDLINLTGKMGFSDIFLLKQPFALHEESNRFANLDGLMEGYKLKYKFASAFDNTFNATRFEKNRIIIYRNINLDVILYTQKLLMDQNESINIQDINLTDINILHFLKTNSTIIAAYLHEDKNITDFDHLFKLFQDAGKPGQAYIAIWTAYFAIYHPKEYWASKCYMYSCNSDNLKTIVGEISTLLDTNKTYNEYFYPGMQVVWTPK